MTPPYSETGVLAFRNKGYLYYPDGDSEFVGRGDYVPVQIDVPADLHRRLKSTAANRRIPMKALILELLNRGVPSE